MRDFVSLPSLIGLMLVAFLITYVPPSVEFEDEAVWSAVGGVLIAFMAAVSLLVVRFRIRADGRVLLGLTLLVVIAIGSRVTEPDRVRWLMVPFGFLVVGSIFFTVYLSRSDQRGSVGLCACFWIFLALISLIATVVVQIRGGVQFFGIKMEPEVLRWAGWYGNPNRLAPVLALGAIASSSLAMRGGSMIRVSALATLGLILTAGVVSTGSRATLLALGVGLVILFWVHSRYLAVRVLMIIALLLVMIIGVALIPDEVFDVFDRTSSNEERVAYIRLGIEMFTSGTPYQIIFGQGYGEFIRVTGRSTHNGYVRMLLEFGVLFSFVMFAFIFFLCRCARRIAVYSREFSALALAFLGFLLVRDIGSPALISVRIEALAFSFVIGMLAARPQLPRIPPGIVVKKGGTFRC